MKKKIRVNSNNSQKKIKYDVTRLNWIRSNEIKKSVDMQLRDKIRLNETRLNKYIKWDPMWDLDEIWQLSVSGVFRTFSTLVWRVCEIWAAEITVFVFFAGTASSPEHTHV